MAHVQMLVSAIVYHLFHEISFSFFDLEICGYPRVVFFKWRNYAKFDPEQEKIIRF